MKTIFAILLLISLNLSAAENKTVSVVDISTNGPWQVKPGETYAITGKVYIDEVVLIDKDNPHIFGTKLSEEDVPLKQAKITIYISDYKSREKDNYTVTSDEFGDFSVRIKAPNTNNKIYTLVFRVQYKNKDVLYDPYVVIGLGLKRLITAEPLASNYYHFSKDSLIVAEKFKVIVGNPMADKDFAARNLAGKICIKYNLYGNKIASGVKTLLKNHLRNNAGYTTTTNRDIVQFLNANKDRMTCGKEKINYMMEAFNHGAHNELFRRLFAKDLYEKTDKANTKVDINAVSYSGKNGAPITVLDYIDNVIATSKTRGAFIKEVKRVKSMFTKHFGAKHFRDLPAHVQQKYLANSPHRQGG